MFLRKKRSTGRFWCGADTGHSGFASDLGILPNITRESRGNSKKLPGAVCEFLVVVREAPFFTLHAQTVHVVGSTARRFSAECEPVIFTRAGKSTKKQ